MSAIEVQSIGPSPGSWSALFSGRNAIYATTLAGGVVLHALNIYVATTIMPSAIKEIGGFNYYSWTTTLFVVASILGAALSANVLTRLGARHAYIVAALIFAVGTFLCAVAPTMPVMLGGRFVQGFGGGLLYALAYGVIRMVFLEALWGRAIGLISAAWGVSTLIGPALGGVYAELDAWRLAFWLLVPIAMVFALAALATLPVRQSSTDRPATPIAQLALLTAATIALSTGSLGQDTMWSLVSVAAALVFVVVLGIVETHSSARLLPRNSISTRSNLAMLYLTAALMVVGMQPEIFVPYLLQELHGLTPLVAGYLAALMAIGWTLGSLATGNLSGGSAGRALRVGPIVSLVGLGLLAVFLQRQGDGTALSFLPIGAGLIAVGIGIGCAWPHLVTRVFVAAPEDEQERAASGLTTVQLFATALGAAAAGTVAKLAGIGGPDAVEGAASAAHWLFTGFAVIPLFAFLCATRIKSKP